MKTILSYEPKGEKVDWLMTVIGSAIGCLAALYARKTGYVIAIKNFSLGQYSFLVFGILLGLGSLWALREYIASYKKSKLIATLSDEEKSITMMDTEFSFPRIQKGEATLVTVPYDQVIQLRTKTDEDEGESQVIYVTDDYKAIVGKGRFQRFQDNFPKSADYDTFEQILREKCTAITNR